MTDQPKAFDPKAFLEFVKGKGDETYNAGSINACALAQFGYTGLTAFKAERAGVPIAIYHAAVTDADQHSREEPFSALAKRLEALDL